MLGVGNLPELQGHFFILSGVLIYSQNLSFPAHWRKIKCQDDSSWQALASEKLSVPGGCAWPWGSERLLGVFMAKFHVEPSGEDKSP